MSLEAENPAGRAQLSLASHKTSCNMTNQTLAENLIEKYGALMSLSDLAELLDSTQRRVSNGFSNNLPWCRPFRKARIKIGRRVHLDTATVAKVLQDMREYDG